MSGKFFEYCTRCMKTFSDETLWLEHQQAVHGMQGKIKEKLENRDKASLAAAMSGKDTSESAEDFTLELAKDLLDKKRKLIQAGVAEVATMNAEEVEEKLKETENAENRRDEKVMSGKENDKEALEKVSAMATEGRNLHSDDDITLAPDPEQKKFRKGGKNA